MRFWFNPPLSRLEEEVEPHADFALFLALVSPRLEMRSFESEAVGEGAYRLRLVLENTGWLPTNVTQKALDRKAVRPIEVALELPDGARIVTGKEREEAGQLEGRVERRAVMWWGVDHSTSDRTKLEWVVEAPPASGSASSRGTSARAPLAPSSSSSSDSAVSMTARWCSSGRERRCGRPSCPTRRPGRGQVLLRVLACGVCRTDLHIVDGELTKPKLPLVLGHQLVGEVLEEAERFAAGDRVGVPWLGWT